MWTPADDQTKFIRSYSVCFFLHVSVCIGYCFLFFFATNNDAAHLSVILALTVISLFSPDTLENLLEYHFWTLGSLFTNPAAQSPQWYSWGPPNMQCRLCASCWNYWKKYGGLKTPTQLEGAARAASVSLIFSLVSLAVEKSFIGRARKYPPLRMSFSHCPGVRTTWSYDTPRGSRDVAIYPQWGSSQAVGQEPPDVHPANNQTDSHRTEGVWRHPAATSCRTTALCFHQCQRCQGWVYVDVYIHSTVTWFSCYSAWMLMSLDKILFATTICKLDILHVS